MSALDRINILVPENKITPARAATGFDLTTPLFDKDTGQITYYIACFHPGQLSFGVETALMNLSGTKKYGTNLTKNQAMGYTNTTDKDPDDPVPLEEE